MRGDQHFCDKIKKPFQSSQMSELSLRTIATLRSRKKIAAVSREALEITRNSQSQNTLDAGMAQEYTSQVSQEIKGRVFKKLFKEFIPTESRISGASYTLDEFLLSPQARTCSAAAPGISRSNNQETREPTGDRSLGDPCPQRVFSACQYSILIDSGQEETHYTVTGAQEEIPYCSPGTSSG